LLLCLLQIFFLLKESELTPSGANLLDGRYAVFGYAVQGQDNLGLMKVRRQQDMLGRCLKCDDLMKVGVSSLLLVYT
jgi:cyclophilin family peptidyl-prolyl cis-trans isomerase